MFRCRHIRTGKLVAIKQFKNKYHSRKKAMDSREIKILQRFNEQKKKGTHCPFVMKAESIEYENKRLFIVFELMEMSLTQFIRKRLKTSNGKLDERTEILPLCK